MHLTEAHPPGAFLSRCIGEGYLQSADWRAKMQTCWANSHT